MPRACRVDLDARIGSGDFAPLFDWLRQHIWLQGSRWSTERSTPAANR